jgi:hypothetical protein
VCDPALAALFAPLASSAGMYQVCTTETPLLTVMTEDASNSNLSDRIAYGEVETLEPLDAFGRAGSYDPAALTRLYGGRRVQVVRGWSRRGRTFESRTLISPYPNAALTRLIPGTMIIVWRSPATR